jgi:hypothetical protein
VALVLTACGGAEDPAPVAEESEETAAETTTDDAEPTDDEGAEPADDAEPAGSDDDGDTAQGISSATLVIDGETTTFAGTDFAPETCAPDRFGIFFVVLQQVDETGAPVADGLLEAVLLHADTDAETVGQDNRIAVTLGDTEWLADAAEGAGQVDTVTVDGPTATATATLTDASGTAQGTLEVTCTDAG